MHLSSLPNDIYFEIFKKFAQQGDMYSILKLSSLNNNLRKIAKDFRLWNIYGSYIFYFQNLNFEKMIYGSFVLTTESIIKNWIISCIFEIKRFHQSSLSDINDLIENSVNVLVVKLKNMNNVYYNNGIFYSYNLDATIDLFWWNNVPDNFCENFYSWPLLDFIEDVIFPYNTEKQNTYEQTLESYNNSLHLWFADSLQLLFDQRNVKVFYDMHHEILYLKSKDFESDDKLKPGNVYKIEDYV
jgi:hypothetical protein